MTGEEDIVCPDHAALGLEPGDVIATGTPSGVGSSTGTFLKPGDLVRATIAPIGMLENPVEAEGE